VSTGRVLWVIWCLVWVAWWCWVALFTLGLGLVPAVLSLTAIAIPVCRQKVPPLSPVARGDINGSTPTAAPYRFRTAGPGWYRDVTGSYRWWDGHRWTNHTRPMAGPSE